MTHNLKPGDLCLIVNSNRRPENIGRHCELVELVPPGGLYRAPDGNQQRLSDLETTSAWLVVGPRVVGLRIESGALTETPGFGLFDPRHLMPLRGDDTDVQEPAERELENV